jgi:transcription factor AP-1
METTFYDDGRSSFVQSGSSNKDEVRKRLTLDLNSPRLKKPRFDVLLSSPDLNMLKLPSPELEKLIMQQNGLLSATPTPNGFIYPTSTGSGNNSSQQHMGVVTNGNNNHRAVTRDQEMYVRGFDDALAELHQQAQHNHQNNIMETGSSNNNAQLQATPFTSNNNNSTNRPPTSSSPYIPNSGPLGLQVNIGAKNNKVLRTNYGGPI